MNSETLKSGTRIFLHLLLPPLLGALLMLIAIGLDGALASFKLGDVPAIAGYTIVAAYVVAGGPSVVYAIFMEAAYRRGFAPGRRAAGLLSALLGLAIGSIPWMGECISENASLSSKPDIWLLVWAGIGLLVGAIVEWIVGRCARRSALTPPTSDP